jgi:hypothetical protein
MRVTLPVSMECKSIISAASFRVLLHGDVSLRPMPVFKENF